MACRILAAAASIRAVAMTTRERASVASTCRAAARRLTKVYRAPIFLVGRFRQRFFRTAVAFWEWPRRSDRRRTVRDPDAAPRLRGAATFFVGGVGTRVVFGSFATMLRKTRTY